MFQQLQQVSMVHWIHRVSSVSSAAVAVAVTLRNVMHASCPSPSVASHPASSAPYQHSMTSHDAQNMSEAAQMKLDKDSIYGYVIRYWLQEWKQRPVIGFVWLKALFRFTRQVQTKSHHRPEKYDVMRRNVIMCNMCYKKLTIASLIYCTWIKEKIDEKN